MALTEQKSVRSRVRKTAPPDLEKKNPGGDHAKEREIQRDSRRAKTDKRNPANLIAVASNPIPADTASTGPKKEVPEALEVKKSKAPRRSDAEPDEWVQGVRISHPQRIVFSEMGATKADLARFYASIAEPLLEHLRGRPLSLMRCPRGSEKVCFFQKHVEHAPSGTHQVSIAEAGEADDDLLVIESIEGVLALVQFGAIEFHTWGATEERIEQPDRITLDLDPDPALNWKTVLEAAQLMRDMLTELALPNFIKTTGGKGLHVVIPLQPALPWNDVRIFSKALADHICAAMPQRFTANLAKVNRRDKIFIDYLRNGREATTVAAFSARARANAPVSMTLSWDELEPRTDVRGAFFNIANAAQFLSSRGADPWAQYGVSRFMLNAAAFKALGLAAPVQAGD